MQAFFILSTQHRADASTPERKSVSMKKKVKVISSLSLAATLIVPSAIVGFAADVETTENPTVSVVNFSPESGNKSTNIASMSKIIEQADEQGTDIIVFPEMSVTGYSKEIPVALAESKTGSTAAYFSDLAEKYDIAENEDPYACLADVAKNRHCLLRGSELDTNKAAMLLIDDFRNGRLGKITLEFPEDYK